MTLAGRVVAITGAADTVGAAVARASAREGARIVVVDLERGPLERLGDELETDVLVREADVTDEAATEAWVEAAVDRFGRLDGVFANTERLGEPAPIVDADEYRFAHTLTYGVRGTWLTLKHCLRAMTAGGGGAAVARASRLSYEGAPGMAAYVASKHAILGLVRSAALEYAREGIRVNAVCPGPSPLAAPSPLARAETPHDVAELVVFLLSDAASLVTGAGSRGGRRRTRRTRCSGMYHASTRPLANAPHRRNHWIRRVSVAWLTPTRWTFMLADVQAARCGGETTSGDCPGSSDAGLRRSNDDCWEDTWS